MKPAVSQRVPELSLFWGEAIVEQFDGFARQKRSHHAAREPRCMRISASVHNEREWCEKKMDQFWCIWIVNVGLEASQQVEGELELLKNVNEFTLMWWSRPQV